MAGGGAGDGEPVDIDLHEALLVCMRLAACEVEYATKMIDRLTETDAIDQPVSIKRRTARTARRRRRFTVTRPR